VRFAKDNGMLLPTFTEDISKEIIDESLPIHEMVSIVNSLKPTYKLLSLVRFANDA
jgi:hypothetical protein